MIGVAVAQHAGFPLDSEELANATGFVLRIGGDVLVAHRQSAMLDTGLLHGREVFEHVLGGFLARPVTTGKVPRIDDCSRVSKQEDEFGVRPTIQE